MEIRNGTYTVCDGKEFEISIDREGNFVIYSKGEPCQGVNFVPIPGQSGLLKGIVSLNQITNAFSVCTLAKFKEYIFQVDKYENNKFRLSTSDSKVYKELRLNMMDRAWYDIWVPLHEIESIWEERSESGLGLPFPYGLEIKKQINPPIT